MSWTTVAATCTTGGYEHGHCQRSGCNYEETRNQTAALGHDFALNHNCTRCDAVDPAKQPTGCLDNCAGGELQISLNGWAYDPNVPATSIDMHVYVYKSDDEMTAAEKNTGKDVLIDEKGLKDLDGKPITDFLPYDDVDATKAYQIKDKTTFQAAYSKGVEKDYVVTFSYQLRTLTGYSSQGRPIYTYGEFAQAPAVTSQIVHYGKGIDESVLAVPNFKLVGSGKDGIPDVYGNTEDVPSILRGTNISRRVIKYTCALTLIYQEDDYATLRFHADLADLSIVPPNDDNFNYTQTISKGDGAIGPELLHTDALADYRFTNIWTKELFDPTKLNYVPYDISNIQEIGTIDLYPLLLPRKIIDNGRTFELDLAFGGYML